MLGSGKKEVAPKDCQIVKQKRETGNVFTPCMLRKCSSAPTKSKMADSSGNCTLKCLGSGRLVAKVGQLKGYNHFHKFPSKMKHITRVSPSGFGHLIICLTSGRKVVACWTFTDGDLRTQTTKITTATKNPVQTPLDPAALELF